MGRVLCECVDSRRSIVRTDSPGRDRDPIRDKGQLFVLSGPSGVGKDAVLSLMRENGLPLPFTDTATTRPQRLNEVDGVDYFFYSDSDRPRSTLSSPHLSAYFSVEMHLMLLTHFF